MKLKNPVRRPVLLLIALLIAAPAAFAQDAKSSLTSLPDSQVVLYINARRLINEAAPRVVPPEQLNKAIADAKQFVDLKGLDYMIASARLKGDSTAMQLPEFLLIVRGNFSADGLLSAARMAGAGMYTQETYGTRTINIFKLKKDAPPQGTGGGTGEAADGAAAAAAPPPPPASSPFSVNEIAATALDNNTLIIGIPAYLRDALDAGGANASARLKPELTDLALRDSNALVSFVADIPAQSSSYLRALKMPPNPEVDKMVDALRQVQFSVNMLPATFGVQSIIRMDANQNASALSGLVSLGANLVEGELNKEVQKTGGKDEKVTGLLHVLKSLTNTVNDNEVALGVSFRQDVVASIVKKEMTPAAPAKKQQATPAATPAQRKGRARKR